MNTRKLFMYQSQRGYPNDLLLNAVRKISKMTQDEALDKTDTSQEESLIVVLDYHPSNPNMKELILRHWNTIERSSSTQLLLGINLNFGYRRPKNLQDILCHTDLVENKIKNRIP